MIDHDDACRCAVCRDLRARVVDVMIEDCNLLASMWEQWRSASDGEAAKLRRGEQGAVGSPRWIALQAIAHARLGR